jgi:hypothetical protein
MGRTVPSLVVMTIEHSRPERRQTLHQQVGTLVENLRALNFRDPWCEESAAELSKTVYKLSNVLPNEGTSEFSREIQSRIVGAVGMWLDYPRKLFEDLSSNLFSDAVIDFVQFAGSLGEYKFTEKLVDLCQAAHFACSQLDSDLYKLAVSDVSTSFDDMDWEPHDDRDTGTLTDDWNEESRWASGRGYEILHNYKKSFEDSNEEAKAEELERWGPLYRALLTSVRLSHGAQSGSFVDFWVESVRKLDYNAPEWPEAMMGLLTCPEEDVRPVLDDLIAKSAEDGSVCAKLLATMSARAVSQDGAVRDCTSLVIELMSREFDHETRQVTVSETRQKIIERATQIFDDGAGEALFENHTDLASEKLSILKVLFPSEQ